MFKALLEGQQQHTYIHTYHIYHTYHTIQTETYTGRRHVTFPSTEASAPYGTYGTFQGLRNQVPLAATTATPTATQKTTTTSTRCTKRYG